MIIDKFNNIMQTLMGIRPKKKHMSEDGKQVYATFQDRLFASAIDVSILFLLLQDLFHWMSQFIYRNFDSSQLTMPNNPDMEFAPIHEQVRSFVQHLFDTGFAQLWLENAFYQSIIIGIALVGVWYAFQTTPGKFLLGIRIAQKTTFDTPTLKQLILRYCGFYLSIPPLMLGFATLGFYKHKQAWHDMIAGTVVIYTKEGSVFKRVYNYVKAKIKKSANDD